MYDGIYRPCPVCGRKTTKRELPDPFKGQVPEWYAYECTNCGSAVIVRPYVSIKLVAKG
jgi:predicted RNA-binding Zn-ribbon protein involved in translation (DUF1610 family)